MSRRFVRKETVELGETVRKFDSLELREANRMTIELNDEVKIQVQHSGSVDYLTPEDQQKTYVVHLKECAEPSRAVD